MDSADPFKAKDYVGWHEADRAMKAIRERTYLELELVMHPGA